MRIPWLDSLSPRRRKLVLWGAGLLLFYTLAGFFIAPPIVRVVAAKQIAKQLNREVTIAKVKLNPFAMSATIRGFLISDKDGKPFVSWDEVYANFEFWSLFTRTHVFKEISVTHPYARAQVNPDRSLNFSDILEKIAKEAAAPENSKPSKPLALRIDLLRISAARLSATDLTTKRPFTKFIGPLDLALQNFATNPDNKNPYSFAGSTEEGEKFSWSGHFFLDPIRSIGDFTLENISLAKYGPLHEDLLQFEVRDGHVDVRASYHVEQGTRTNIARLTNASVAVKSLKIAERGAADPAIEVSQFAISGVSADAFGRIAQVRSISTSDGRIALRRNADASINLIELTKPGPEATNVAGSVAVLLQSVTNVVDWLLRTTNTWVGALHEFSVSNYAVRLEDLAAARPVRLDLDDIRVNVRHVSNVPGSNMLANLSLRWNTNGIIKTDTELSLFPIKADVKLALDNMEIRALDPYLDPFVNLLITQGSVGMNGHVRLARAGDALPEVSFRGDVWVKDLATVDGLMTEDFLKCGKVRVSGIEAQLHPLEVAVKEISLQDAYARLVIASDKTNNLFAVLKKDFAAGPAAEPDKPKSGSKKPSKSALKLELPTNLIASARTTLPKITVGAVVFTNAQLSYVDRSLQPGVAVAVAQVNGSISGLSSEDVSRADVNLTGKVDNTAPMAITGKINPLSTNGFTDLKVNFRGIELIPTSPYSGKFLGYRLNKGKLSLDLHYQLAGDKLKGQNLVTVDQLMLGDKVESPDATKLPVRLGIAILKDRSGKIELDVPVEGSLSDPAFRLGKVITRALVNVFTKIVTSPFAALGAIFGGKGEEVSFQDFAAGSAELQEASKQKLDAVARGLFERPGLQLEIEGSADAAADRDGLRRLKLEKEFRTKKWTALRKADRAQITPEQVELTPEEYNDYLKQAHAAAFSPEAIAARAAKSGAATPPTTAPATTPAGATVPRATQTEVVKGATALIRDTQRAAPPLPAQNLEGQLLELIEISESDFSLLAAERARRVKGYLIEMAKVEPERVFLAEKPDDTRPARGSRVYLHLR
jgi:hypothetical protein